MAPPIGHDITHSPAAGTIHAYYNVNGLLLWSPETLLKVMRAPCPHQLKGFQDPFTITQYTLAKYMFDVCAKNISLIS